MSDEPRLSREDHAAWGRWMSTCAMHARTRAHARAVDGARRIIGEALSTCDPWCVAFSGGKDSRVLTQLVCVDAGYKAAVIAHKDDLDFPESEPYVRRVGEELGLDLRVVRPPLSPAQWMADNAATFGDAVDLHSRTSELARAAWWDTIDNETAAFAGYFDGLAKHESRARTINRALRGNLYPKRHRVRGSIMVAHPIHDWTPKDVYGYCAAHGIELLPLYKCIALMDAQEPWRVREEWWVPSEIQTGMGRVAWLRHYYPSLYRMLIEWMPAATRNT